MDPKNIKSSYYKNMIKHRIFKIRIPYFTFQYCTIIRGLRHQLGMCVADQILLTNKMMIAVE